MHSSSRKWRHSDLESLGPGISLYFKMLKYFSCYFFLFVLLSIPNLIIFASGNGFYNENISGIEKGLSMLSLGNLNSYGNRECSYAILDTAPKISFECSSGLKGLGFKMKSLDAFGLAFKDNTCRGLGRNMSVSTIDRCSSGSMTDPTISIEF